MKKTSLIKQIVMFAGFGVLVAACAPKEEALKSGYDWAIPETQAMQDDDFSNPAFMWVDIGNDEWSKTDGEAGKSCADCHGADGSSMKGKSNMYPVYNKDDKKLRSIQDEVNNCRTNRMKAKAWKWESDQMLGMAAFIRTQSRDMPINVAVDGDAAPFFEAGKEFYETRRGGLDMACTHCHVDFPGVKIRANVLTNGLGNGFPTYRLKWQKPGSIHRRFRGCNKQVRAKKYGYGSDEYVNLELYVAWRGRGLSVETPAVRN